MNHSRTQYLAEVNELLDLVNDRHDLNESEKHYVVKKKLALRMPNITVPKLGLILFYKVFPGKTGGVEYYKIKNLYTCVVTDPFKIVDEGITLEVVKMTEINTELRLRKNLRALHHDNMTKVPYKGKWITARFFDVIDDETLSIGIFMEKGESIKARIKIETLRNENNNLITFGNGSLLPFVSNFSKVDLLRVKFNDCNSAGVWIGEVKILSRNADIYQPRIPCRARTYSKPVYLTNQDSYESSDAEESYDDIDEE